MKSATSKPWRSISRSSTPSVDSSFMAGTGRRHASNSDHQCGPRTSMAYPHQSTREDPSTDSGQADALGVLRRAANWFEPNDAGFGPLLDAIDDASLVLIGEASHGTHEFYRTRAELTKALVLRTALNIA